jgi:hypothetical protein
MMMKEEATKELMTTMQQRKQSRSATTALRATAMM